MRRTKIDCGIPKQIFYRREEEKGSAKRATIMGIKCHLEKPFYFPTVPVLD